MVHVIQPHDSITGHLKWPRLITPHRDAKMSAWIGIQHSGIESLISQVHH